MCVCACVCVCVCVRGWRWICYTFYIVATSRVYLKSEMDQLIRTLSRTEEEVESVGHIPEGLIEDH